MSPWLKRFWLGLNLGCGGVLLLLFLTDTSGENREAASLAVGLLGSFLIMVLVIGNIVIGVVAFWIRTPKALRHGDVMKADVPVAEANVKPSRLPGRTCPSCGVVNHGPYASCYSCRSPLSQGP